MALVDQIPLPTDPGSALLEGATSTQNIINSILNNRLNPSRQKLMQAQAQQAQGNAAQAQMIANLIQQVFGGNNSSNLNISSNASSTGSGILMPEKKPPRGFEPLDPLSSDNENIDKIISGSMNSNANNPKTDKAKSMLQALGFLKETPDEQAEREIRTAYQKEIGSTDAKSIEDWNKILTSNSQITPVLENIQELAANPALQAMYKNPEYMGYDLKYLKRFGTKEQQELLTSLGTNAKSIFQAMGQEFKGAFREFELNLFNKAAPDETNDTLPQIISKTNTMMALRDLATKRLSLANNIVRSSSGAISPANALLIADKRIDGKKIREDIKDKFQDSEKQQRELRKYNDEKEKSLKNNDEENNIQNGRMTIIDSNGQEHTIRRDKLEDARKIDPGLKVKKEKFSNAKI